jgi:hypothetical protein
MDEHDHNPDSQIPADARTELNAFPETGEELLEPVRDMPKEETEDPHRTLTRGNCDVTTQLHRRMGDAPGTTGGPSTKDSRQEKES